MSSIEELESQWLQARFAADYKTRIPKYEIDARYRAEVDRMQFELETARANAAKPAPSTPNAADVELLNRAMKVNGGRTYFEDAKFRERVEALRSQVYSGGAIPADVRAATEADLSARGVA